MTRLGLDPGINSHDRFHINRVFVQPTKASNLDSRLSQLSHINRVFVQPGKASNLDSRLSQFHINRVFVQPGKASNRTAETREAG